MTSLAFLAYDPTNARVVDVETRKPLYNISTDRASHVTTVRDARGQPVAEWRHTPGFDELGEVTFKGETKRLSTWLPKRHMWSRKRKLTAPDGTEYIWKKVHGEPSFKLVDPHTEGTVAQSHLPLLDPNYTPAKPAPLVLDIEPEVTHMLEAILLSFVVLEYGRWHDECVRFERSYGAAARGPVSGGPSSAAFAGTTTTVGC